MNGAELTISLTTQEVDIVLAGLGKIPAETSYGVINKVRTQALSQLANQEQSNDGQGGNTGNSKPDGQVGSEG